jgi:hypothetical protein
MNNELHYVKPGGDSRDTCNIGHMTENEDMLHEFKEL